ncbi:hypothetical protein MUG87_06550 [Ectobacillus sp. JY-23]|uniref:hypothetical protein n=1 Tax=Ectobacillus sp. JY-23 TaxID=2933872 RepID=UPI001FF176A9|nr:hypothetical protein [Ectobacillus sp. JY-23]UOY93774.1 hypothetical protein MUG87_06550 [Ectobacillus sp. JY-23]
MRSIQDALYNWLTIKTVAEARPDDEAAKETYALFADMLFHEHGVTETKLEKYEEMYMVYYTAHGLEKTARFPSELIDCYVEQMEREPQKFQNYK